MDTLDEKTEKSPLPVVAIDGAKIKTVREAKKLTQLYVASVVGVTTDTISRWENNRYPTIKRDNAEKLANALEVELEDILRREEQGEDSEAALLPQVQSGQRRTLIIILGATVLLMAAVFVLSRHLFAIPVAERNLPAFGAPGEVIPVQIKIVRKESGTKGFIAKERLPAGWRFVASQPPAVGKTGAEELKWLVPAGTGTVTISYTVQIPPETALKTSALFTGEVVAHVGEISRRAFCEGDTMVTVDAVHWADDNGDGRIDDDEIMPAYYLTEGMKGLGLDWEEIEAIWSGKGYRWDSQQKKFEIIR
jgi:transcriptional regulator with XRE-family HTH domain